MWKEYYKIGVDYIDEQHKELCDEAERLLRKIQSGDPDTKDECIRAITFLKDYSVTHFAAEEEYQLSISFSDRVSHKAAHEAFITTVLELEQKLADADYDIAVIKEVAGFLTSWLTYHIAETDQKLKKSEWLSNERTALVSSYLSCFAQSTTSVLETMGGLAAKGITFGTYSGSEEDIRILIGLLGDYSGEAVFTYSKESAFSLIEAMTSVELFEIDELAHSALSEISNIISGNATGLITAGGKACDIEPPRVMTEFSGKDNRSGFFMDTEHGEVAVSVNVM